jgi:hypothetical protein
MVMPRKLNKQQQNILRGLFELGGEASIAEVAAHTSLNPNGVSQSIGSASLRPFIERVPVAPGDAQTYLGVDRRYQTTADGRREGTYLLPIQPPAPSPRTQTGQLPPA